MQWDDLPYWDSEDWRIVQDRLDVSKFNPARENLFASLDAVPLEDVKVAIIGQDPYPDPRMATGLAFSIPEEAVGYPPTLETIFKEYQDDLHYPYPSCGSLRPWADRGVLLWNCIPSCAPWKSLSHDWPEWEPLSSQIIEELCKQGIVFVLLGGKARRYADVINYYEVLTPQENILLEYCHPSPRANASSRTSARFCGSRVFTRINDSLESLGRTPINWRL
jgi:uracil-DNA glycosylase